MMILVAALAVKILPIRCDHATDIIVRTIQWHSGKSKTRDEIDLLHAQCANRILPTQSGTTNFLLAIGNLVSSNIFEIVDL